ncbi:electron transfer flavoprotein subunit beta/FixA family protein [Cellulomonas chengniuliangii]|uniref:Electron transfer flavoprotein small subunit n=1 Tax=Cellulomonas chengniuliangii TaxID=2968084 RepID=A0ABY5L4X3_9CELL|nr:electron transfer flavoprotein subunit beta/FixA family protein [Cellulomonas chengniuliangii]MCC2308465.1 electron transfer flavoprotein subunit beta/FixA family protein [Cellulomonas chengniuliangii]MCC2317482.1 electron transfer flavoprotein subunit beta/FixA family protein [Cellulomonas chengniuliangii]UUI76839.1 electron transfer flavoprotein subunit beta/FixA family protein [Cellulomonas chengniuliangii]
MDILVLVKQVPGELADVRLTAEHTIDRSTGGAVTDPVDRNALEAAVQLVEAQGGAVTVLTMGPASAKAALKECVSVGATRGVHINDDALVGADAWGTAQVLAAAARRLGEFDLVLAGARSFDGGTSSVPAMVAELLGLPQVTNVTEIEADGDALVCRQVLEDGHARIRITLPGVVTVDEYVNTPRYPSVKSKLAANKASFDVLTAADLGIDAAGAGATTTVLDITARPPREPGVRISGTPEEIADELVAALVSAGVL